jgi:hypothetical protein
MPDLIAKKFVMAAPPGPREARPEGMLHDAATQSRRVRGAD